jgi:hypothetical protein
MASSYGADDRRQSTHPSSPALSAHQYPTNGRQTPQYQDSKLHLIPNASPYRENTSSPSDLLRNSEGFADEKGAPTSVDGKKMEVVDRQNISGSRKRWVFYVWALTFWIPSFVIRWIVGTPRRDIRQAWREKLAINLLIWLSCGSLMFFMGKRVIPPILPPMLS